MKLIRKYQIVLTDSQIADILDNWFNNRKTTATHFWERNEVAKIIKNHLVKANRWKGKKRGAKTKIVESIKIVEVKPVPAIEVKKSLIDW